MKHSILCCAVTGALASGAAFAADTQIYGVIDTGFSVRNNQYVNGNSDTTTRMVSGQYIGSRFGIKGSEDLGNGYKAGFVLESSIKTDDGSLGQGGRLWPASTFPATSAKSASAASARSSAATVRTPASATS